MEKEQYAGQWDPELTGCFADEIFRYFCRGQAWLGLPSPRGIGGQRAHISAERRFLYPSCGVYENKHDARGWCLPENGTYLFFSDLESFATASPDVVVNVTGELRSAIR